MAGSVGVGDWVTFFDATGRFCGGKVTSDEESFGGGSPMIWVDAIQPDGRTEQTPVPVGIVRLVPPPDHLP